MSDCFLEFLRRGAGVYFSEHHIRNNMMSFCPFISDAEFDQLVKAVSV